MDWPLIAIVSYLIGLGVCVVGFVWLVIEVRRRRAHLRQEQDGRGRGTKLLIYAGEALAILGGIGIAIWADPVSGVISVVVPLIAMYFCGVWPGKGPSSTTPSSGPVDVEKPEEPSASS